MTAPAPARGHARSARRTTSSRAARRTPPRRPRWRAWSRTRPRWRPAAPTTLRCREESCEQAGTVATLKYSLRGHEGPDDDDIDGERYQERRNRIVGGGADADRGARRLGNADYRDRGADLDQQGHFVDERRQCGAGDLRQHNEAETQAARHAEGAGGVKL